MKTNLIRIGNSRGVRIPKALIEQARLSETVELEGGEGGVIIRSAIKPRAGWDEAFRSMHEQGDDALPRPDSHGG
jgi:antitoxin MazE